MKFSCDKCKTRYTISDEKVRGKVLKIRCKTCGNVVEVRESAAAPERPEPEERAAARPPTGAHGALMAQRRRGSQVERLKGPITGAAARPGSSPSAVKAGAKPPTKTPVGGGRVRPGGAGARPTPAARAPAKPGLRGEVSRALREPADDEPKTMIAAMPQELLASARGSAPAERARPARAEGGALDDGAAVWYLGDDRGEYGPMTFAELAARVKRGEPGPSAEVWKEGLDDWLPLAEVPELKPFLKRAPPPRPTATTRAAPPSPYQKRPELDAVPVEEVPAPTARPGASKSPSATAEYDQALVKAPSAVPAPVEPAPAPAAPEEEPWPAVPGAPSARPDVDVFSLPADLPPAPQPAAVPAVGAAPLPASHVSLRAASDLGSLLVAEQRRARRPILIISLAAVLIAGVAVALVVWLISSGKKSSDGPSKPKVAEKPADPRPREAPRAAMAVALDMAVERPAPPGGDARELPELDIDVTPGSRPRRARQARRSEARPGNGRPAPDPRPAVRRSGGGGGDPLAVPALRPMFAGIDGFGGPRPSGGPSLGGGSGGAPANLGTVVKRNYNRLKRCYEQAARIDSRLRNPKLSITVKVSTSGRVTSVYVAPARYAADTLGICVRRSIMGWKFPSHGNDYRYSFTARFHGG